MRHRLVRRRDSGFTLIELVVVLAVLGLVLSLVLMRGPSTSPTMQFDSAIREVVGTLRLARSRAIADDRVVMVGIAGASLQMDGDTTIVLPTDCLLTGNRRIAFTPDGGSSGGRILLHRGPRVITVDVDWLTGRVQLAGRE